MHITKLVEKKRRIEDPSAYLISYWDLPKIWCGCFSGAKWMNRFDNAKKYWEKIFWSKGEQNLYGVKKTKKLLTVEWLWLWIYGALDNCAPVLTKLGASVDGAGYTWYSAHCSCHVSLMIYAPILRATPSFFANPPLAPLHSHPFFNTTFLLDPFRSLLQETCM